MSENRIPFREANSGVPPSLPPLPVSGRIAGAELSHLEYTRKDCDKASSCLLEPRLLAGPALAGAGLAGEGAGVASIRHPLAGPHGLVVVGWLVVFVFGFLLSHISTCDPPTVAL